LYIVVAELLAVVGIIWYACYHVIARFTAMIVVDNFID